MTATTRHADAARKATGFVLQTMHGRGMRCLRPDLEQALVEFTPEQLAQVHAAALAVAKGSDARDTMGLLAAVGTVSRRDARAALARHTILYRADVLLPLATGAATALPFAQDLAQLQRTGADAVAVATAAQRLQVLCGPLGHENLLPDLDRPAPLPVHNVNTQSQPHDPDALDMLPLIPDADTPSAPAPHSTPRPPAKTVPVQRAAKVFGQAAALTWELAPVRTPDARMAAQYTVMIEGAAALGDGTRGYDWRNKVVFACTSAELPQLLAVLMGWIDTVVFAFHGGNPNKKLTVRHQPQGVVVTLQGPGRTLAAPVTDADRYALVALVLHTMVVNDPVLDAGAVLQISKAVMTAPAFHRMNSEPPH